MKDEPDIIKELREKEKLGKLKNLSTSQESYKTQKDTENYKEASGDVVNVFEGPLARFEKHIEKFDENYRSIFENYAIAITIVDEKERVISWNRYTEELLEMNEKDLSFKDVSTLYPPEEWKKIRAENIRRKGIKYKMETRMTKKNGEQFDVEISLCVLKGAGGKTVGSIGIIKDITRLKTTERKLTESEERYKTIFENSAVAITLTDENEQIISWNKYTEKMLDMSEEDLYMKPVESLYPEDEWKKIRTQNIRQRGMQHHLETKILKRNKEPLDVDISISVLKNHEGNVVGSIGVIRDITDQKRIENELDHEITEIKRSEERYKNLFETALDPISIIDKNGYFIDINKRITELLGYNKKDLVGKKISETNIFTKKSLSQCLDNFLKGRKDENIQTCEVDLVAKHGEIIPVEINISALYENGEIVGDLVVFQDLRDKYRKKEMEKELIESENRFRDIFNATSDFLLYLEGGIILDINKSAMELGGLKKEETIGKKIDELRGLFSAKDINKHLEAINNINDEVKLQEYEVDLNSDDGQMYKFLFSADYIKDDKGVKAVLIRGKDITQRQRAWEELVKLEERYRVLAETSADGVVTIDPLGRLTYINPSFEKLCGRRKSQILATLFRDYLSDESVYFFQQITIDARKKNEKIENVELEIVHADDNIIPIEVNVAPFKKNNEFAGLVCTIRDITERRKIENELKKSERLKTEFMNIAAHELKSPVTPIKGYLDLIISDKNTSEQIKNWAKVSLRNAERLLKLVNDILDVSRLDTDTMRFDMEKLDAVGILDEIAEDMKPVIENKKLKFIVNIPRDLPNVIGDRHRLSQVLKNLFVNAIKFTDNGSITVEAEKKGDHILISVKDTGIGISKDELKKIFNKFYQAYTGDDRKNEGTGLGLYICKEIIRKHNGEIWAESEIGKGSQFHVKLPYLHKMVVNLNS